MWTVIKQAENRHGATYWLCQCNCGTKRVVLGSSLNYGSSTGCGRCARQKHFSPEIVRLKKRFANQRWDARITRGIPWHLTWEQWFNIWQKSGKLDRRGPFGEQYVMARHGDQGAYEIGNVKIITAAANLSEAHTGKTPWNKRKDK